MGSIVTAATGGLVVASPKLAPYLSGVAIASDAPSAAIDSLASDGEAVSRRRRGSIGGGEGAS